jgi:pimeloyl-ACP methyl ester carboxylesterase
MKTNQTIIIPGFGGNAKMAVYRKFQKTVGKDCYVFTPAWKYHSIHDWIKEYECFIKENDIKNFTAIGFSVGAYIIACSNIIPQKTIYASMSPLFTEDIHNWTPKMIRPLGKWRMKSVGTYTEKPATTFIVGEKELPIVFNMIKRISGNSKVITIKGVGHDISNKKYFDTVIDLIKPTD